MSGSTMNEWTGQARGDLDEGSRRGISMRNGVQKKREPFETPAFLKSLPLPEDAGWG